MKGVRLTKRDLLERFPISNRVALRVGALLAKNVDISEAVLETAERGSSMEKLLLDQRMLRAADKLNTDMLAEMASDLGLDDLGPLVVHEADGWRTIVLEEEMLAEQGWQAAKEDEANSEGQLVLSDSSPVLADTEIGGLFSSEELAQLKLAALTSADSAERISAMRRIMFSRMASREQGAIMLQVLLDPISSLRSEALKGLEQLGLDHDAAEAMRMVLEDDEKGKMFGALRLKAMLRSAQEMEVQIVYHVFLQALREIRAADVKRQIVECFAVRPECILQYSALLDEIVETCVRELATDRATMAEPVRELFTALGDEDPQQTAQILWRQCQRTQSSAVRTFLMIHIGQMDVSAELKDDLSCTMVEEILADGIAEEDRVRLSYGIARAGKDAIPHLLARVHGAPPDRQAIVIRLLDTICVEQNIGAEMKTRVARAFLELIKIVERRARLPVLQALLCCDPEVAETVQRELANEFVANMLEFRLPDILEQISLSLELMGGPALAPLLSFAQRDPDSEEGDQCFRVLARVLREIKETPSKYRTTVNSFLNLCLRQFEHSEVAHGGFAIALAQMCAAGWTDAGATDGVANHMLQKLWKVPYSFDLMEALTILGGSDTATLDCRVRIVREFSRLLELKPPDELGKERQTEDGTVYEFGHEVDFDTVVLPTVVRGMQAIALSPSTTRNLRQHIIDRLIQVWGSVSTYKIVWSPLAVETLANALGKIGCCPATTMPYRIHIARLLRHQINRLSVVRSLGNLFGSSEMDEELSDLAVDTAFQIITMWASPESAPEERKILLECLTRIASRSHPHKRSHGVRVLRQRTIELLFEALKDNLEDAYELLAILRDCPDLSKRQKAEIKNRLDKAMAMIKGDAGGKR